MICSNVTNSQLRLFFILHNQCRCNINIKQNGKRTFLEANDPTSPPSLYPPPPPQHHNQHQIT